MSTTACFKDLLSEDELDVLVATLGQEIGQYEAKLIYALLSADSPVYEVASLIAHQRANLAC